MSVGMGVTYHPNQYEVNKSDKEKVNDKNKSDKQQHVLLQEPTTPNVNSASALDKIGGSFHDRWKKAAPKIAEELKAKKAAEEASKESAPKKASEDLNPWDISGSLNNFGDKLTGKSNSESSEEEKDTYKSGNPNGDLDVDLSNTNPKDGWGRLDGSDMDSGNSTPVAKPTPKPTPKPKVKAKTAVQKPTVVDDGKTKGWYENLANSSYANDKEHEADMKTYREMQAKATADNDGKSKEWYENLANSSYADDKKYEADMKAFRKMQADEIAKNGYYTDSQGVKVYAKAMTDKPKKENNNE